MSGRKKKVVEVEVDDDGAEARDIAMARLAAARSCAQSVLDSIDDALAYFIDTEEDADGDERKELVETALDSAGAASRALEAAQKIMEEPDFDFESGEEFDDEDEEEDDKK